MLGSIYSNNLIRKYVTSFGSLFTNITVVRYNKDGSENQRFIVKLGYGGKEKYMMRLQDDPQADRSTRITLPTMSFEMIGLEYDSARKGVSTIQNFNRVGPGNVNTQYNTVPYNFNFNLMIYTRTIADVTNIVEQILPFFNPDYTLRVNLIPSMNITKDVPIILDNVTPDLDNLGDEDENQTRLIIWTLNFTLKGWLYGPVSSGGLIREAITNLYIKQTDPSSQSSENVVGNTNASNNYSFILNDSKLDQTLFVLDGNSPLISYKQGEIVYQGSSLDKATATATVVEWIVETNRIVINNVTGTFLTNTPIIGSETGATFTLINYEINPNLVETIIITPNPANANVGNVTGYNIEKTIYQ